MANALFDIPTGTACTPYVGIGAGFIWTEVDKANLSGPGGARYHIDDTDANFAYQGIAGVAFGLRPWPFADRRSPLPRRPPPSLTSAAPAPSPGCRQLQAGQLERQPTDRPALRLQRAAAPVAVAPAPAPQAPAVARTYLVFFDWNKADLTDRARQIIAEAAGGARRVSATRIEVAGHADRSAPRSTTAPVRASR